MSSPGEDTYVILGPLAQALLPHATSSNFCTYKYDGGIDRKCIEKHVSLIKSVAQVKGTLAFKRDQWMQALKEVAKENLSFRSRGEQATWQTELQKRLSKMCRHAGQYLIKESPPNELADDEATGRANAETKAEQKSETKSAESKNPETKSEPKSAEKESKPQVQYDHGYDADARCAFRTRKGGKKVYHPEYAISMHEPPNAKMTDSMSATFKNTDGTLETVMVAQMTVAKWRASADGKKEPVDGGGAGGKKDHHPMKATKGRAADRQGWVGTDKDGTKVEAFIRSDDAKGKPPKRLAVVAVDGHAVVTINVQHFEETAEKNKQAAGLAWASVIAEKLAAGTIDKDEAIKAKMEKLSESGFESRVSKKRPAAAVSASAGASATGAQMKRPAATVEADTPTPAASEGDGTPAAATPPPKKKAESPIARKTQLSPPTPSSDEVSE
ncbi:unnamed protein product [Prorocentrum cordatum]|uniref:Uncharacterized protein n=1 Tax=Prorocentrum cordatum TaxID=2364126 RepID=A0ABN9PC89_9DINO|nr:unnamed protein product [Polarella glacialis]